MMRFSLAAVLVFAVIASCLMAREAVAGQRSNCSKELDFCLKKCDEKMTCFFVCWGGYLGCKGIRPRRG
ncbi:hypothetical protein ScPMuIL_008683 [Solemya velum]